MLLIWGQKWGRYRRYYYGLPLRFAIQPITPTMSGFFMPFPSGKVYNNLVKFSKFKQI